MTVDKVCGSGLKSVILAAQAVRLGDAQLVVAGGQENMSASPHILAGSRDGQRMGDWQMRDTMLTDGLTCAFNKYHMGITAENIADKYALSREEQDAFAATSQQRAEAAVGAGWFGDEICAVSVPQRKGEPLVFAADEFPKPGITAEKLGKLRPAFKKDGTVTVRRALNLVRPLDHPRPPAPRPPAPPSPTSCLTTFPSSPAGRLPRPATPRGSTTARPRCSSRRRSTQRAQARRCWAGSSRTQAPASTPR